MTEARVETLDQAMVEAAKKLVDPLTLSLLRRALHGNERVEFRVIVDHDKRGTLTVALQRVVVERRSSIMTLLGLSDGLPKIEEPAAEAGEQ